MHHGLWGDRRPWPVCLSVCRLCTLLSRLKLSAIFSSPFRTVAVHSFIHSFIHFICLLTFTENFTEIVPGDPSVRGFKRKRGSQIYRDFDISKAISRKRCKIAGKLVLITDMKS